jgi:hypothetical protein
MNRPSSGCKSISSRIKLPCQGPSAFLSSYKSARLNGGFTVIENGLSDYAADILAGHGDNFISGLYDRFYCPGTDQSSGIN